MTQGRMPLGGDPTCADPGYLPLVDKAFSRGGVEAGKIMARQVCPSCPVRTDCYTLGDAEHGPWGGLPRMARTRAGQAPVRTPNKSTPANLRGIDHGLPREQTGAAA